MLRRNSKTADRRFVGDALVNNFPSMPLVAFGSPGKARVGAKAAVHHRDAECGGARRFPAATSGAILRISLRAIPPSLRCSRVSDGLDDCLLPRSIRFGRVRLRAESPSVEKLVNAGLTSGMFVGKDLRLDPAVGESADILFLVPSVFSCVLCVERNLTTRHREHRG